MGVASEDRAEGGEVEGVIEHGDGRRMGLKASVGGREQGRI